MRPAITHFVALAWFALAGSLANAADLPAKFDPLRDGAADVAYATSLAKQQGKRVIVDVGGEWCVWCHIMDRFIAANPEIRALIDTHYIWLKVNFSKENENAALLGRWPRGGQELRQAEVHRHAAKVGAGRQNRRRLSSGGPSCTSDTGGYTSDTGRDCLASAQATCSRTSGDGSSARRASAAATAGSGAALPSATAILRDQRS